MRYIEKSPKEPSELLEYRQSAGKQAYWDGFPDKAAVSVKLLEDQGSICCYCMRRIDVSSMKIEHYLSRARHPKEQLRWTNLLAACKGGEGGPIETCDRSKADKDLAVDPQNRDHVATLRYLADGTVITRDKSFEMDIDSVLNLNAERLKQSRAEALLGFQLGLKKRLGAHRNWSPHKLCAECDRIRSEIPLREFAGMLEWWMNRAIERRRK